jgi:hypothetical protein
LAFAFNPDDGRPARLIRYVAPGTLPSADLVALYDHDANLLILDKNNFEKLTDMQKHLVLRNTKFSAIETNHFDKYRVWGLAA